MTRHTAYLTLLALLIAPPAIAADERASIPIDSRIKILTYTESDVYTIPAKTGYQTSVEFARNEEITTISVGDRTPWQIVPNGNRMFIRPLMDDVQTNMTVITNIREYHFDLKSVGDKATNNIYVAQFRYPDEMKPTAPETLNDMEMPTVKAPEPVVLTPAPKTKAAAKAAAKVAPEPAPKPQVAEPAAPTEAVSIAPLDTQRTQQLNTAYTYTGPDAVAPNQVYDDGRNTYVLYETLPSPAPKPYITAPSGEMVLANHRVVDNKIVLFSIAKGFMLKSESGDIVVYNESIKAEP